MGFVADADATYVEPPEEKVPETGVGGNVGTIKEKFYRQLFGLIPGISGSLAAMAAGPTGVGSIPAATLASGIGSGAEELLLSGIGLKRTDEEKSRMLRNVLEDMIGGGAAEAGGVATANLTKGLGKVLNEHVAVRPDPALVREHPDLMDVLNNERFPLGTAKKHSPDITNSRQRSAEVFDRLARASEAQGERWHFDPQNPPDEVAAHIAKLAEGKEAGPRVAEAKGGWINAIENSMSPEVGGLRIPGEAGSIPPPRGSKSLIEVPRADALAEIAYLKKVVGKNKALRATLAEWEAAVKAADNAPGVAKAELTAKQLKGLKRSHAGEGAKVAKVERAGQQVLPAGTSAEAELDLAIGRGFRRMMAEKNPILAAREARTSSLIGAEKAIDAAEMRGGPKMAHVFGGPGVIADLMVSPIMEPRNVNFVARGLMNPKFNATESIASKPVFEKMLRAILERSGRQDELPSSFEEE